MDIFPYLVGPLDDDAFNTVFQLAVTVLALYLYDWSEEKGKKIVGNLR